MLHREPYALARRQDYPAGEVLAALTFIIAGLLIYFKIAPH
jgi:hypothetical protein